MSATEELRNDIHKDPSKLEREADEARADLQHTFETLEARFSPGELLDRSLELVKRNGGDFGRNLGTQVRNNPIPTILAGVSIAWLIGASKRPVRIDSTSSSARDQSGSVVDSVRAGAGSIAQGTRDAAASTKDAARSVADATRHAADRLGGSARTAAATARTGARSAREGYEYLQREQPFVLGALAVAAGAAIGAALPSTRTEDRWVGEASENTKDHLKDLGREGIERAEDKTADVVEAAGDALATSSGSADDHLRSTRAD